MYSLIIFHAGNPGGGNANVPEGYYDEDGVYWKYNSDEGLYYNTSYEYHEDSEILQEVVIYGEQQQNGGNESWYSWNGPLMRYLVPDKFTIALGAEITGILGIGVQPITFSILTRGKEPSIYYTPQVNANLGAGAFFSAGVEFTSSRFTGDPRNITASMMTGHTYGIMANGGYLEDFSVGVSFSPTDWSKKEGFVNGSGGFGVGVGAFGGAQYQYTIGVIPLWQWKR